MKKIVIFIGTRPEVIKLAPVVHELKKYPKHIMVHLCATSQHKAMLIQTIEDFDIQLDSNLQVMQPGQALSELSANLFIAIDQVLVQERPDWVLVQGDTTTVMVASLCAFYRKVKVAHVEAGLRSSNKWAPFPEEVNRKVTSILGDLHFAPTHLAKDNLIREGIPSENILVTGNTVIDALFWILKKIRLEKPALPIEIEEAIDQERRIMLITGHRRENFGGGLRNVCLAIRELASYFKDILFVYPVHLNPQVRECVYQILDGISNVVLCAPLNYKPFIRLIDACTLILTDSGGIQEEAPSLGKPVLVTRDVTERPEGIQAGVSILVGTNRRNIVRTVKRLLVNHGAYVQMAQVKNPYGDGKASKRITESLKRCSP